MSERLQRIISQWGIASRRQAEQLIVQGRVRLNGVMAQLGQTADPRVDLIEVDGQPLLTSCRPQFVYLLLHKPAGIVSSCKDPGKRRTVLDLLPRYLQRQGIHPVGRLDRETTGALLLTNDGQLTFRLTHPRHQIPKTYQVWVQGHPAASTLQQWRQGVMLDGKLTLPAQVTVLTRQPQQTHLEVVLWEGRNRQIRRVAEQLGHPVLQLHRSAIGPIQLSGLREGDYRNLKDFEIRCLQTPFQSGSASMVLGVEEQDYDCPN